MQEEASTDRAVSRSYATEVRGPKYHDRNSQLECSLIERNTKLSNSSKNSHIIHDKKRQEGVPNK